MVRSSFPTVRLVENAANIGFGPANNRALRVAAGKYVFYLNSDAFLLNNAVKMFFDYWEGDEGGAGIGAIGCNLVDEHGAFTHSYGSFPTARSELVAQVKLNVKSFVATILHVFRYRPVAPRGAAYGHVPRYGDVDYITGAALFMKNDENARFDERYFLYYEETDLEFALKEKGLRRILIDGPRVCHLLGKSGKGSAGALSFVSFSQLMFMVSRVRYVRKNVSVACSYLLAALVWMLWVNPLFLGRTRSHLFELRSRQGTGPRR
jgi:GT2 family glycosyltransferase